MSVAQNDRIVRFKDLKNFLEKHDEKIAKAMPSITVSTVDIGEGAELASGAIYIVIKEGE